MADKNTDWLGFVEEIAPFRNKYVLAETGYVLLHDASPAILDEDDIDTIRAKLIQAGYTHFMNCSHFAISVHGVYALAERSMKLSPWTSILQGTDLTKYTAVILAFTSIADQVAFTLVTDGCIASSVE